MKLFKKAVLVVACLTLVWQVYARWVAVHWNVPVGDTRFDLILHSLTTHNVSISHVSLDGEALDLKGREVLSSDTSARVMERQIFVEGRSYRPRETLEVVYRVEGADEDRVVVGDVRVQNMSLPTCVMAIQEGDGTKLECFDASP